MVAVPRPTAESFLMVLISTNIIGSSPTHGHGVIAVLCFDDSEREE